MDTNALIIEWLRDTVADVDPKPPHVTDQVDASRHFPQLEVTFVTSTVPARRDGRLEPALLSVAVGVTAWSGGNRRHDFASAWATAGPVIDALAALSASWGPGWVAEDGTRIENASQLLATQSLADEERHAVVNISWRFRVRRAPEA